jgi:hypothetical protein
MVEHAKQENIFTGSDSYWGPIFGDEFLPRLAGSIMQDPHFAVIELVANCWDAGASAVEIEWPVSQGGIFCVQDNGISMSKEEFRKRWNHLSYDRTKEQGKNVTFPKKTKKKRKAFGRNGIGRHAMFYFSSEYFIEMKKEGRLLLAKVKRGSGSTPFDIKILEESSTADQGTKIWCETLKDPPFTAEKLAEVIGIRFVSDPEFEIKIDDVFVEFETLTEFSEELKVLLENGQEINIKRFETEKAGRTSKQSGIAYWVNRRLVGMPTWDGFDGTLLDARHTEGKRYTYVVDATLLEEEKAVKPDWSGFYPSPLVNEVKKKVSYAIRDDLKGLTKDLRDRNSKNALDANKSKILRLPTVTRQHIQKFADEVQLACPTISIKDLENVVSTLAKLEDARTGYQLLEKLSSLDLQDLDALYSILDEWSIDDAKKVLVEIEWRVKLLIQLEHLIPKDSVDELHQLQPLFDRGLWILGHEYDSLDFSSNRELSTILRNMFDEKEISRIRNRPDFVAVPNESSLSVYSKDDLGNPKSNRVIGYHSVVILELKRPGVPISYNEIDQAKNYAREIKKSVSKKTRISCYVLGREVDDGLSGEEITEGNINIYPTEYTAVLGQAKRRLFHLRNKIGSFDSIIENDYFRSGQGNFFHEETFEQI